MINIGTVRDVLVVVTTLITILSAIIKIGNNLLLDVMKSKFCEVPGKQSMLLTVVKSIGLLVYTINCIILFFYIITSKSEIDKQISGIISVFKNGDVISSFTVIMYILFFVMAIITITIFSYLINILKKMIYNINFLYKSKLMRRLNIFNIIVSLMFSSVSIICIAIIIGSSFAQKLNFSNYEALLFLSVILIFSLGIAVISFSSYSVMRFIESKQYYYIRTATEIIICRFYLEYKNYYLVIEDNTERFIKISEVKEIKIKYEK